MNLGGVLAELFFVTMFVVALLRFLRQRDALRARVALVFLPLASVFVATAATAVFGRVAGILGLVAVVLLFAQPLFTILLVGAIERVPRIATVVVGLSTLISLGAIAGLLAIGAGNTTNDQRTVLASVVVGGVFFAAQLVGAGYLVLAARRRRGAGAARLALAAAATAALGIAVLLLVLASIVSPGSTTVTDVISWLAAAAGLGYVLAFLPPGIARRLWQAEVMVDYGRTLVDRVGATVPEIWHGYAELARDLGSTAAVVVMPERTGPVIVAAAGFPADPANRSIGTDELRTFLAATDARRGEARVTDLGPSLRAMAEQVGARYVGVVRFEVGAGGHDRDARADRTATLVLFSPFQTLFYAADREILTALGAETAIVAERRAIEAEVEALAERLATSVDALRAASQAKSDFLASMSHELRTPLSAILGFSDLMRHEYVDGENVDVPIEWVHHVHRGAEHLLALINDVLDLSKIEAGRIELHPESLDLAMAVAESMNGLRPLAERKQLRFGARTQPVVTVADRGRIRQILYNLLSNAIKYTPEGGEVDVLLSADADEVRLAVRDTGPGIDPADHEAVFEEFRQVGDPSERQPGTGLGLALTRRLAEAHGGRVELASARGAGSTFTVILPLRAVALPAVVGEPSAGTSAPAKAPVATAAAIASGSAPEVLIIEDDPSAVRLIREYIEPSGFHVRAAATGEQGLAEARAHPPSAIILDVLLPDIDGWEVLRRLHVDERLAAVPVLIVSVVDEREVGLALGAIEYLVKPVERGAVLAALQRLGVVSDEHRPMQVLVVDDDPSALGLIRAALEPDGYLVRTASGGRQALTAMRQQPADIVVCDLVMPDVDGFEVVAELKREQATSAVPILVYTSHDLSEGDKARLNGHIMGIVDKSQEAGSTLRTWLHRLGTPETGSGAAGAADQPGSVALAERVPPDAAPG